jgi:hypothetical protein
MLEELLWQEGKRRVGQAVWAVLGVTGGLVLFVVIFVVGLVAWLSGGVPGVATYLGSAEARPVTWLGLIQGSNFPNVVELGDMGEESGGKATATDYNCSNGQPAGMIPCNLAFGPNVRTMTVDAGLMEINSGTPPPWPSTPKWARVFGGKSPYSPAPNIQEGIRELNADVATCNGYLEYGLSDYNTGACQSAKGLAYAASVLGYIQAYQAGPEVSAWATGNYTGQSGGFLWWHWGAYVWRQPYANAPTWIMAQGSFALPWPAGAPQTVLWAPAVQHKPCAPNCPPVTYSWTPASTPTMVWLGPHPGSGVPMSEDPPGAPVEPGQQVWAIKVTQPGTYTMTAEWKWQTCSGKPPTCVWHRRYATSQVVVLPAKTG